MRKVIVIGGGPAGVTAALRARELGALVTLIERGRHRLPAGFHPEIGRAHV